MLCWAQRAQCVYEAVRLTGYTGLRATSSKRECASKIFLSTNFSQLAKPVRNPAPPDMLRGHLAHNSTASMVFQRAVRRRTQRATKQS